MSARYYTIIMCPELEEGGYSVLIPAFDCATQGETWEEAIAMAKDAILLNIKVLEEDGEPVPEDGHPQAVVINIDEPPLPIPPSVRFDEHVFDDLD